VKVSAVAIEANGNSYRVKLPRELDIDTTSDEPPDAWRNLLALLWTLAREIDRAEPGRGAPPK